MEKETKLNKDGTPDKRVNNGGAREDNTQKNKPNGGRGGARPGSGRKVGVPDQLTIKGLLAELQQRSGGKNYESILVEDFLDARAVNDRQLMLKYHTLILNKVMNSLAKIEVTDSSDALEAKKAAFAEALANLTGISEDK